MTRTRLLAAPLALALAAAIPMAAFAQPGEHRDRDDRRAGEHRDREQRRAEDNRALAAATVDAAGAITAARNAGFRTIREVEWERGVWEVKAINEAGQRTTLYVDAASGNVVVQRR
ncbi:hypothetical protein G3576_12025 [Roseomonas stagni]|uniref:PepSY domain-containing protein n=1 Tax=Falsiroseomonas algicola TaxID=2716930 RepID=A0A6M1LKT7_9PROT|nr:PepSY domain-containing protein [Falsiroseomonas algicola]NGM20742.1 hypothetical protein [Falsiroseomonas algicola]